MSFTRLHRFLSGKVQTTRVEGFVLLTFFGCRADYGSVVQPTLISICRSDIRTTCTFTPEVPILLNGLRRAHRNGRRTLLVVIGTLTLC